MFVYNKYRKDGMSEKFYRVRCDYNCILCQKSSCAEKIGQH